MHPRNRFRTGYANPGAVLALNQALLADAYGLKWSIPRGALCPPIPSRCDYIHHLADLLSGEDEAAMHWARQVVRVNTAVASLIECRFQSDSSACFEGVAKHGEGFAASMCNPDDVEFIQRMIAESASRPRLCRWFTTLVPKSEQLPRLRQSLARVHATDTKIIRMVHGQKKSRILAWRFGGLLRGNRDQEEQKGQDQGSSLPSPAAGVPDGTALCGRPGRRPAAHVPVAAKPPGGLLSVHWDCPWDD